MFFRLLIESLRRGSRRKLVTVTAVALGILASTALLEILLATGDRLASEMGSYGANIEILPAAADGTFDVAGLSAVRDIFWRNNIVAVAPLLELRVRFEPASRVAPLVGTWFDRPLATGGRDDWRTGLPSVRPTLEVEGRWPKEAAREVVLGRRLAARLGVGQGGEVTAELAGRRDTFTVVGLVVSGGDEEEKAFAPLEVVQALAGREGPRARGITRAEVFALTNPETENLRDPAALSPDEYDRWYCTAYPSSIAHQIDEVLPDARAEVVRGITSATAEILDRLRLVFMALATVALVGAAVGASAAMTASVLERRLEAGLLVALGAEGWKVAFFFLCEAGLLGVLGGGIGGLAGLPAGRFLGDAVFGVSVPWVLPLLPLAVVLGFLLAVLGGVPPVIRALVRHPASMLKRATA